MKIAVVGAGIHGASAAKSLVERGHQVTLFDQFYAGHAMGSSHGESRIVRKAYPDAYYTGLMAEAYPLWKQLENQSGEHLLQEVGLLYFGLSNSPQLQAVIDGLVEVGVPHDVIGPDQIDRVSPQLKLGVDEVGVFTPEAGWVDAARSVAATTRVAKALGVSIIEGSKVDIESLENSFDSYVVCPGAWISEWVPNLDVSVTLQSVAFFEGHVSGPVWIQDSEDLAYGFPTYSEALGVKLAFHTPGGEIDPCQTDREADPLKVEALGDVLCQRFGMNKPVLKRSYGCLYTTSSDEDFRVARLGTKGYFASPCSGHGFKFGPWIGKLMADFVEEKDVPERWHRFAKPSNPAPADR